MTLPLSTAQTMIRSPSLPKKEPLQQSLIQQKPQFALAAFTHVHKLFFLSGSFLTRTKFKIKFGQRATNIHVSISDQQLAAAVLL